MIFAVIPRARMIDTLCNDRNKFVDSRFCETARRDVTERERCSVSEIRIYLGTIDFDLNWLFVIIGSVDGKFGASVVQRQVLGERTLCLSVGKFWFEFWSSDGVVD